MSITHRSPVVLLVLDGWGYREETHGNAIALANAPVWRTLWNSFPRTLLHASGLAVGLPEGQMGNSEVGHLNLGAGRVVKQDIVRIGLSIVEGDFFQNTALTSAFARVRANSSTMHLVGLLGNGGVHSHSSHLYALIDMAERMNVDRVMIHLLIDGRDTLPTSGAGFMRDLLNYARGRAHVATVCGRYFGMDRDLRWPRTEKFYRAMVHGAGERTHDPVEAINKAYAAGITDEFIEPLSIPVAAGETVRMSDDDEVICFNFRSDRMRQIVRTLSQPDFTAFEVGGRPRVSVTTMTTYDRTFTNPVAFEPFSMSRIVAEVLSEQGKTMFRTAETEKYAHVTYFFNGGLETPYPGEDRCLVASQKVATYDLMPEMSAPGVTDVLCKAMLDREHDFILCNYANADMVGHSGSLAATIKAVESVDACLGKVLKAAESAGARLLITADHGNAEYMIDEASGGPHTAHTCNPVPLVSVDYASGGACSLRGGGALCDVGPTILDMLGVVQPFEMTGVDLRRNS